MGKIKTDKEIADELGLDELSDELRGELICDNCSEPAIYIGIYGNQDDVSMVQLCPACVRREAGYDPEELEYNWFRIEVSSSIQCPYCGDEIIINECDEPTTCDYGHAFEVTATVKEVKEDI
jgi:DNA-directed RNA polymerase subunit RPC12/RpoP